MFCSDAIHAGCNAIYAGIVKTAHSIEYFIAGCFAMMYCEEAVPSLQNADSPPR
jgi:hypothetical protein